MSVGLVGPEMGICPHGTLIRTTNLPEPSVSAVLALTVNSDGISKNVLFFAG